MLAGQGVDEHVALGGHERGRGLRRHAGEGRPGERQSCRRGVAHRGHVPQQIPRGRVDGHLAGLHDHAVPDALESGSAGGARAPGGAAAGRDRGLGGADGAVQLPGHGPGGLGEDGVVVVGGGVTGQRGDGVLVGATQAGAGGAGDGLQRVAGIAEGAGGGVDDLVVVVGEPALGERADHGDVAQPAAVGLEIRLGGVGERAVAPVAALGEVHELPHPAAGAAPPGGAHPGGGGLDELLVPGHAAQVQQGDRGPQVGAGDLLALLGAAHRMVQRGPGVPDRVPHRPGELGGPFGAHPGGVHEQHEVEVAGGAEGAPAEGADRGERGPAPPSGHGLAGPLPQGAQPVVDEVGLGEPAGGTGGGVREALVEHLGDPAGGELLRGHPPPVPRCARARRCRRRWSRSCRRRSGRCGRRRGRGR